MSARPREPFFWALFSSGGMLAALVLPALAAVLFLVLPLGWADADHGALLARLAHPLARLAAFGLVALAMFHWAHRFRYTLYDGLQLYHLSSLIAVLCYGGATAVALVAAWFLATFP
jgi:fumarate reductase subunit D